MNREFDHSRASLAGELARRVTLALPTGLWPEDDLADWMGRHVAWIFEDAVSSELSLDETLVRGAEQVLEELNEPLRQATGASWPPSKVAPWPLSESAGVDTNRIPWAVLRGDAIHLGYGEGDTAALIFEPILLESLRASPSES